MIRKVLTSQDPRLRQKSKRVTKIDKKILNILKDMEDTLKVQKDPEGVGLAAPQIGEFYQIFLMQKGKKFVPVLNPKIIKLSKKTNDPPSSAKKRTSEGHGEYIMEGCLSLPHYYGPVQRAWEIEFAYETPQMINDKWQMINRTERFVGFPAQIIQHEVDHLDGKIFIDKLFEQNRQLFQLKNKEWVEVNLP